MIRHRMTTALKRLGQDQTGATIVEFALITPALMVVLMGLFDLAYNMYTNEMLNGAVQQAARMSTVEGAAGRQEQIDSGVVAAVRAVAPGANMTFSRKAYAGFSDVNRPEDWDDDDNDGTCNNGEAFEDENDNGTWDNASLRLINPSTLAAVTGPVVVAGQGSWSISGTDVVFTPLPVARTVIVMLRTVLGCMVPMFQRSGLVVFGAGVALMY